MLGLPESVFANESVCEDDQLSHDGGERMRASGRRDGCRRRVFLYRRRFRRRLASSRFVRAKPCLACGSCSPSSVQDRREGRTDQTPPRLQAQGRTIPPARSLEGGHPPRIDPHINPIRAHPSCKGQGVRGPGAPTEGLSTSKSRLLSALHFGDRGVIASLSIARAWRSRDEGRRRLWIATSLRSLR
jgi:hypothetical protein